MGLAPSGRVYRGSWRTAAAQISPHAESWTVRLYILVTPSMRRNQHYHDRVNRVLDYISENLDGELSLIRLSGIGCFSPFHFHRVFQGVTGETLNSHVRRAGSKPFAMFTVGSTRPTATHDWWTATTRSPRGSPRGVPASGMWLSLACRSMIRPSPRRKTAAMISASPSRRCRTACWARLSARGDGRRPLLYRCLISPNAMRRDFTVRDFESQQVVAFHCVGDLDHVGRAWQYLYRIWLPSGAFDPADLPAMEMFVRLPEEIGWETFDLHTCIAVVRL